MTTRAFGTLISGNRIRGGELSEAQRGFAAGALSSGTTKKEVADALHCSESCVKRTKRRILNTATTTSRPRMGRPPILTRRDHRRLARIVKKYPKIEFVLLMKEAGFWDYEAERPTVSRTTIGRAMAEEELHHFRSKRRPLISKKTAKLRVQLTERLLDWDFEKQPLRFSDECSVERGSGHNTTWVWRLPSQKWNHEMIEEAPTGRQPARMVWGEIWLTEDGEARRSPLIVMTRDPSSPGGGYTAWSYQKALREGFLSSYDPDELFMLDNSPIHTALSTQDWLELHDVRVLDWPPYSPDLNPIEHMWLALKRTLYKLHPEFDTIGDTEEEWEAFEAGLKEAWAAIPDTLIQKLILSMPRRLAAYKAAKGYQTKY